MTTEPSAAERREAATDFFDEPHGTGAMSTDNPVWAALTPASPSAAVGAGEEWPLIQRLRDEEADSVTILCDNPDGPPNAAVECCGFWTGFADRRFGGETIQGALKAAVTAKDEAARVGYPEVAYADFATATKPAREDGAALREAASGAHKPGCSFNFCDPRCQCATAQAVLRARAIAIKHALPGAEGISTYATNRGDADDKPFMQAILAALAPAEQPVEVEPLQGSFEQGERQDWGDLHRLQHCGPCTVKPKSGGHIVRWAADEIAALRTTRDKDSLDGNDIWEALFGILRGNVPDKLTYQVCNQLAAALSLDANGGGR